MPIVDLFSSRTALPQAPDIWTYDKVSGALRVQVSNILEGAFGVADKFDKDSGRIYDLIRHTVAHEHGRDRLAGETTASVDVHRAVRQEQDMLVWLDVVELSLHCIEWFCGNLDHLDRQYRRITIKAQDAIDEVNERFRRAGFGYRYERGKMYRVDTEFMHQQATLPALGLLSDPRFSGADQEFRAAHEHLKAGEYKDCAVDALNALESTMKAICDAKGWAYDKGARASDLIKLLRREQLFPDFVDQSFDQLVSTLKSGLPVVRNKSGGHGQGAKPVDTPEYIAVYALNLAASKIRLLYEAFTSSEK